MSFPPLLGTLSLRMSKNAFDTEDKAPYRTRTCGSKCDRRQTRYYLDKKNPHMRILHLIHC